MTAIQIPTPSDFKFMPTVLSHGWHELPSFKFIEQEKVLERIQALSDGKVVKLTIGTSGETHSLSVDIEGIKGNVNKKNQDEVRAVVKRCLNIEQDLKPFYRLLRGRSRYAWVSQVCAGRLLISPTVWEDLAKTLLTTNTTWNVTVQMCRRLAELGDQYAGGGNAFPTPHQVAALKLETLSEQIRVGYRAPYLHDLATAIAEGSLDVERWHDPDVTTDALYRQIKSLKGFGEYAVGSVLKLLGRFDRLGIDTSSRDVFRAQLNNGQKASDDEIRAYYDEFGSWRGLVMWMDVMKMNLTKNLGVAE